MMQQPPFLLDTGRIPHMGFEPRQDPSSLETVNEFTKRMESATEEAKSTIHKAQEDITRYYNRRRSPAPVFKPGDWVYLDALKGCKRELHTGTNKTMLCQLPIAC